MGRSEFECTKKTPWMPGIKEPVRHPDAKLIDSIDGYPGGDIDIYKCPNCGKRFEVEIPQ